MIALWFRYVLLGLAAVLSAVAAAGGPASKLDAITSDVTAASVGARHAVPLRAGGARDPMAGGSRPFAVGAQGLAPLLDQAPVQTQVSSVNVSPNPVTAGAQSTYTITFTTSPNGALGPGATITLLAPRGTSFLGVPMDYTINVGNGHSAAVSGVMVSQAGVSVTNNQAVLTLGSSTIAAGDFVAIIIDGVTNPNGAAGSAALSESFTLSVSTSADKTPTASAPYTIVAGGGPTPVPTLVATSTPAPTPTPISTPSPSPTPAGCGTATYAPGFNLVGVPGGTVLSGAAGALYTFQAADTNYEVYPVTTVLGGGIGVWAFFPVRQTVVLACAVAQPLSIALPANRFIMVGNPNDVAVSVTGADEVLAFNPATGQYSLTNVLLAGQGAWAISGAGGTLTLTPGVPTAMTAR